MKGITSKRSVKVIAITLGILMVPVAALAAIGSFSSNTTAPAVTGKNSSSASGAKAIYGSETNTGSALRYGVFGSALGTGGIGVGGQGSKYGVYSSGNLGVAAGKSLVCSSCVTATDLVVKPPAAGTHSSADVSTGITSCANQDSITVVAPKAGTVLVMADMTVFVDHTSGNYDEVDAYAVTTSASCPSFTPYDAFAQVAAAQGTDGYFVSLHIVHPFTVTAGSHTFYLTAANFGFGALTHWRDSLNTIFISS